MTSTNFSCHAVSMPHRQGPGANINGCGLCGLGGEALGQLLETAC